MKNPISVSILELAIITQDSNATETFQKTKDIAQLADKLGYKRIWLAEHHNMAHVASTATVVLIGYVASQTEKIRVGSGGIMLPNHSPLVVAEQFGTLETLYPNRIDLGLGRAPGTDQPTAEAIRKDFFEQAQRFPQNVSKLQEYFSSENETGKVRAFPAEGLKVPIWILGSSMDSAALAAAYGLPYAFAGHFAPKLMIQAFEFYRENFQPSEYLDKPKTMACVNIIAADTNEEAELLSTSLYQMFLNLIRNDRKGLQPPVPSLDDIMNEAERFHVNQMTAGTFTGNKEQLKTDLKKFIDYARIDELMVTSPIFDHQAKLKSIQITKEAIDSLNESIHI
ncbi:LLM class flavin-dependent oxidoreductase [Flavobacterium johnsoniae]|uniref:Luciferase-like monooxygenase n=1 Tax=Flavobacterium johnsoniae (strain ATCC 17061 / DSM 2064 / JCM 8514 / BCRC 14874 / CCUG 350202 / NBRC 14942 / NCIMB 11054 / UW101) TaxID=376686 RepID=A5FIF4_FLAJ1|nr:LLM class flavin-dependent oxidoreductase [Flavobacterium johnsoniae]ABQ05015.1 luciferase family protein [Flavobacterium johnsoniae UW101]OXE98980.1 luciferase family oxidoreductase [Flavobacterium johnsoniae UW101]WQG83187.1 LLM class flavin-dependent oxidoreductase [Flavobacterium johnsoniae UW101]SHK41959.1 luciferase family oxidoreductase, group 1 [Flavobacterium johnsoniae]